MSRTYVVIAVVIAVLASPATAESLFSPAELSTDDFEGSKWRVSRVNGIQPPRSGAFNMGFRRGKALVKFGCNLIDADFWVEEKRLIIGKNKSKEFYCSEPFAGFETDGMAIIKLPMYGRWIERGRRLELFSQAGSLILLRR